MEQWKMELKIKRNSCSVAISDYKKSLAMFHGLCIRDQLDIGCDMNHDDLAEVHKAKNEQELRDQ